ncbi:glycosyltransferase family 2 protein [Brevibacterium picturae]
MADTVGFCVLVMQADTEQLSRLPFQTERDTGFRLLELILAESTIKDRGTDHAEQSDIDVSVIIPVHNCESFVEESIRSVASQELTDQRVEIIAVDDGSTDESFTVLSRLAEIFDELSVFTIPNSGSASAPRNFGLDHARGRYVFFLDADDKLEPNALRRLVTVADDTGSGVVLCKLGEFGPQKRASNVPTQAFKKTVYAVDYIESKAYTTLGALKLYRRSTLQQNAIRFPLGYTIGEDQPFAMKAYFHSPHVSILSDRVYYWARGRHDGTNVTSQGQSARKHYLKIKTLIDVIASGPETGSRRNILLRRPLTANAGVPAVFGKPWLLEFGAAERRKMVSDFRELIASLWNDDLRASGTVESQLLIDLLIAGDVESLESVSSTLANNEPIALEFDHSGSQFVYRTANGRQYDNLNLKLSSHEDACWLASSDLHIRGTVGTDGGDRSPDNAQMVWVHRRGGVEKHFDLNLTSNAGNRADRTLFDVKIPTEQLDQPGEWDAFIRARWGKLDLTARFGKSKAHSIRTSPTYIGSPISAAVIYTRFGNLTIDVGPTQNHLSSHIKGRPENVGRLTLFRHEIATVRGDLGYFFGAKVLSHKTSQSVDAEFVKHGSDCASVVVPRAIFRRGPYTISLIDVEGTAHSVDDSACNRTSLRDLRNEMG